MGQETTTTPFVLNTFRGLNTKLSQISISQREAVSIKNLNLTTEALEARVGQEILTTTQLIEGGVSKAVTGIYQAVLGGTKYQVITGGSKIYSMSDAGVLTDITGAVTLTDDPDNLFSFALAKDGSGNDIIVAANGVDAPIKWTGTGNADVLGGSPPGNFKHIIWRKNRLYGTDGEFIYHSELLDAETWDPLYWVARFSNKGFITNDLTGMAEFGDGLAIFKERAIYIFTGDSFVDGYVQQVVSGDGCISGYSIVDIPSRRFGNILAFVNGNGEIKGFDGSRNLIALSDPIDANTLSSYNKDRAKFSVAVNLKKLGQYLVTCTASGGSHNRIVLYDYSLDASTSENGAPESTMLIHEGISANYLGLLYISGSECLLTGTYDGWILVHNDSDKDIVQASEIDVSPTGAVRSSNVVTITTIAPHNLSVDDEVIVSGTSIATGSGSFDGTFTVTATPTSTTFTYSQTESNATGGGGIVRLEADIETLWRSKQFAFKNAGFQKQLNDFNIVTFSDGPGDIQVTASTERMTGVVSSTISQNASSFYGDDSFYGESVYGGGGTVYSRVEFDTGDDDAIVGRYFQFSFENVDGFRFGLEEFLAGITDLGYQAEYEL